MLQEFFELEFRIQKVKGISERVNKHVFSRINAIQNIDENFLTLPNGVCCHAFVDVCSFFVNWVNNFFLFTSVI